MELILYIIIGIFCENELNFALNINAYTYFVKLVNFMFLLSLNIVLVSHT